VDIKNIEEVNKNFLIENLTAQSFLDEKKLIIINLETTKKESSESITTFLLETIEKIPENNIVLLHLLNPDKRSKLYKGLKEKCKTKEFNT
jgi:DNA polymerase III delta subunit